MKKFLLKIILVVSIFILIDKVFGYILEYNRPTDYNLFLNSKLEFFKNTKPIDVLIIGDSHIADALDPRIIESHTNLKTFNLGIYHTSPFQNYYITKAALESLESKPKFIVLGTNPNMFEIELSKGKYPPLILPTMKSLELVKNSKEGFDASFFLSIVQEKYLFKSVLNNLLRKPSPPTRIIENVYNGHLKFFNQMPAAQWTNFVTIKESKLKKEQVEYFSKTIELALQYDIAVIIAHPPLYKENLIALSGTDSYKDFNYEINKLIKKYHLKTYYNYSYKDDTLLFHKQDFLNSTHLNHNGSLKFTNGFSDFLKSGK
jgi:hypothetical protein